MINTQCMLRLKSQLITSWNQASFFIRFKFFSRFQANWITSWNQASLFCPFLFLVFKPTESQAEIRHRCFVRFYFSFSSQLIHKLKSGIVFLSVFISHFQANWITSWNQACFFCSCLFLIFKPTESQAEIQHGFFVRFNFSFSSQLNHKLKSGVVFLSVFISRFQANWITSWNQALFFCSFLFLIFKPTESQVEIRHRFLSLFISHFLVFFFV